MSERRLGGIDLALLESLFDGLPDSPFFVKDAELRYVAANQAMLRLCGVSRRADLIGRTARDFFPEALARRYEALDRQVLRTGRAVPDRLELTLGADSRLGAWLLFARVPVTDGEGAVVGVSASARRLPAAERRNPRLARVVGEVQRRFHTPLDLAGLAHLAGVSKSQLERDFRSLFGVSLQQFQTRLRVDRALDLLAGHASVAEVAAACGYADQSAFARRFRAATGLTPSQYRSRGTARG